MDSVLELVKVEYSEAQNNALREALKAFYRLADAPKVEKALYVAKSSYQSFLRGQLKQRTPFQSDRPFSSFAFDETKYPFDVVYSKISFKFPSDRTITLTEYLAVPNGLTKSVELSDSDGIKLEKLSFDKYLHAESEVINRFLAETTKLEGTSG